jgi:hypothetical protein
VRGVRFFNLSEPAASGPEAYRVQCLRVGHWDYPGLEGGLNITPELLIELKRNFDAGAKGREVPVDGPCRGGEAHSDSDLHDCGWCRRLEIENGQLWAYFDVTNDDIRQMLDEGSLRYCSVELDLAWFDPEDKTEKRVFEGLSLTNRPYIKNMDPVEVNLSEASHDSPGEQNRAETKEVPMAQTAESLQAEVDSLKAQLAEAKKVAVDPTKLSALEAKLKEQEEGYKARLAELETANRKTAARLRMTEIESRLKSLVRRGQLTAPVYARAINLSQALVEDGKALVHLSAKVKLGEQETDSLDVVEELVGLLSELPQGVPVDDDVDLDEDGKPTSDDDNDLDLAARAAMKENPKLTYREAVSLAERRRKGGN